MRGARAKEIRRYCRTLLAKGKVTAKGYRATYRAMKRMWVMYGGIG